VAFSGGLLTLAAGVLGPPRAIAQTPFVSLFNGTSLDGWVIENQTRGTIVAAGGVLRVEGPDGWLRSINQYEDFTLRVEVRFLTPDADSGLFLRAPGPASNIFIRGWPANAYQVQARDISVNKTTNPIWIGNLYRHRITVDGQPVPAGETRFDADAAAAVFKPTGQWQVIEVDVRGERLTVTLNGTRVTEAFGIVPRRGYIGIQAETGALEYRKVEVTAGP
jgi:hypothetical protein